MAGACKRPEGAACAVSAECASGVCMPNYPLNGTGTCRVTCDPSAPSCVTGRTCYPLSATAGTCVPTANPTSQWRIRVASAIVDQLDPASNTSWDSPPGPPDPYYCVQTMATSTQCSTTVSDTYTPSWSTPLTQIYTDGDLASVSMRFYDEDLFSDDTIDSAIGPYDLRCGWAMYPCSYNVSRTAVPASGLTSFVVSIEPN